MSRRLGSLLHYVDVVLLFVLLQLSYGPVDLVASARVATARALGQDGYAEGAQQLV